MVYCLYSSGGSIYLLLWKFCIVLLLILRVGQRTAWDHIYADLVPESFTRDITSYCSLAYNIMIKI